MKKLTFSEFDKYTYTDNEYFIKEIHDWKFAELQDYHGNRIKEVVISEKTKYYRKKTKSEFYNKVAYNHKGENKMTKLFILKTSEKLEVFPYLEKAISKGNDKRNQGFAECKVYAYNTNDLQNAYKVYECLSETEEEDLTQQIINNVIDDFYQGLNNDLLSKFEETAYFDLGYEDSMIEDIKERILEQLQEDKLV